MRAQWRPAALCLLWFTVLTGAVYPLCLIFDSKPPDIGQKALEKRENMWGWCRLEKQCSGII